MWVSGNLTWISENLRWILAGGAGGGRANPQGGRRPPKKINNAGDNKKLISKDMSPKSGEILLKMRNQRGFEQRDTYAQSGPILEPINHIHIQFYNKNTRDIQILKEAGFVQQFPVLRNNLVDISWTYAYPRVQNFTHFLYAILDV